MSRRQDETIEDRDDARTLNEWKEVYPDTPSYIYIRLKRTIKEEWEDYDEDTEMNYTYIITKIDHWSYFYKFMYRYIPSDGFNQIISKYDGFVTSGFQGQRQISTNSSGSEPRQTVSDQFTGNMDEVRLKGYSPCFEVWYNGDLTSGYADTIEENVSEHLLSRTTQYLVEDYESGGPVFENKGVGWHLDQNTELVHLNLPDAYVMENNPTSWELDENGTLVTPLLADAYVDRQGAFSGCDTLTEITIPATCTSIGMWSFYGTSLTEVELPEECTYYATSFPSGCRITGGILIDEFGNPVNNEI